LPSKGLRVNLGCGYKPLDGWLNLDMARGEQVDIVWNLLCGLPFASDSCEVIFGEHVIEHVLKTDAGRLLAECYRVLQPGGVLRISTPDAERYLRSYASDGEFLRHPAFEHPIDAPIDRVNIVMREFGQHLWVYDAELLMLMFRRAGFPTVVRQEFRRSSSPLMEHVDSEARAFESLYVEGIK
jgi:predicted SAM-dependent methyltransferase